MQKKPWLVYNSLLRISTSLYCYNNDAHLNIVSVCLFFTITIRALERTRTITSVSLSEERQILKEISSIKRIKPQVEEYNKMDEKVQVVKVCL